MCSVDAANANVKKKQTTELQVWTGKWRGGLSIFHTAYIRSWGLRVSEHLLGEEIPRNKTMDTRACTRAHAHTPTATKTSLHGFLKQHCRRETETWKDTMREETKRDRSILMMPSLTALHLGIFLFLHSMSFFFIPIVFSSLFPFWFSRSVFLLCVCILTKIWTQRSRKTFVTFYLLTTNSLCVTNDLHDAAVMMQYLILSIQNLIEKITLLHFP